MRNGRWTRIVCAVCCTLPLVSMQTAAHADVIGAQQFFDGVDRRAALDRVDAVLARAEVRAQLEHYGVDPTEASERVSALSDGELMSLADDLERLPAGGSLLGTVGIVFIVLLILELVGVIDIFKKI
jgi:Family of unknown function (DUF6627)